MPPGGGGGGDEPRSGLREVDEEDTDATVFDVDAGSVMALTAAVPSSSGASRISTAVPFVMPVRTVTPRMADPS